MIRIEHVRNMVNDWGRLNVTNDYVIESVNHICGHMDVTDSARRELESARSQALKSPREARWEGMA